MPSSCICGVVQYKYMLTILSQILVIITFLFAVKIWHKKELKKKLSTQTLIRHDWEMILPIVVVILTPSIARGEYFWIILFWLLSIVGIVNECLLGVWFERITGSRAWKYYFKPLVGEYGSVLGIPMWGIGMFLFAKFLSVSNSFVLRDTSFFWIFFILSSVLILTQLTILPIFSRSFKGVSLARVVFFFIPTILLTLIYQIIYGSKELLLFLVFAAILIICEYLFGYFIQRYMGKRLWSYEVWSYDDGHFSVLILPLAIYSGLLVVACYQGLLIASQIFNGLVL